MTEFSSFSERNGRQESQGKQKDVCIGRIALGGILELIFKDFRFVLHLGKNVRGVKERDHYKSVCDTPRQVFSMWHTIQ